MEIHELNTFGGTPGASDYLAIDNGSDTSKISADDLFGPLNDRIDNIIAGGDAPSAAEVTDARLGASILGSVQYSSLGAAIRGQATALYDDIIEVETNFNITELTGWVLGKYINTSGSTVDVTTETTSTNWRYIVESCQEGDKFTINAKGGGNPRAWCFIDSSGNVLSQALSGVTVANQLLIAPENASKIIINDNKSGSKCYKGEHLKESVSVLDDEIDYIGKLERILMYQGGYIKVNVSAGDAVSLTPKAATGSYVGYAYNIIPCQPDDKFVIGATGSGEARAYAFVDSNNNLIRNASVGTYDHIEIVAPANADKLIINDNSGKYSYKVKPDTNEPNYTILPYEPSNWENQEYFNSIFDVKDLLNLEKVRCIHHDNFMRDDNASDIGNNGSTSVSPAYPMNYETLTNVDSGTLNVGINNNRAVATRSNVADAKVTLKTVNPGAFPYKIIASVDDDGGTTNYYGSIAVGVVSASEYVNITFNRNLITVAPNATYQIDSTTSITHKSGVPTIEIYVYQDRIAIYNVGVKLIDIKADLATTVCGMRFRAGNSLESGVTQPYAYTNFCVFLPNLFAQNGIDRAIENYTSIDVVQQPGQTEEEAIEARNINVAKSLGTFQTGTTYGITFDTDNTLRSKRAVKFDLRYGDPAVSNGVRAEIVPIRPGIEVTLHTKIMSFDVYFPSVYPDDTSSDIIMQMHDYPDGVNIGGLNPGIALVAKQGNLCINIQGKSSKILDAADKPTVNSIVLCPVPKGEWTNVAIFLREGYMGAHNPVVAVWINGELKVVNRDLNCYNEVYGSYIKFGMYKDWLHQQTQVNSRIIEFDNIYFWI